MATYVTLLKWTDQGLRNIKGTVQRAGEFRADLERRGGKLLSIYWTQGQYDIVAIFEAPDAQAATAAMLVDCSFGNVRTETFPAFSEREMMSILQRL